MYDIMKRTSLTLLVGFMVLILPISIVFAASTSGTSIVHMDFLNNPSAYDEIALSGNGDYLVVGEHAAVGDGNITLYDVPKSFTGGITTKWSIDTTDVYTLRIDDDGSHILAVDGTDDTLTCYGKDGITPLWSITAPNDMSGAWMSDNGDYVAYYDTTFSGLRFHLISGADKSVLWSQTITSGVDDVAVSNSGHVVMADLSDAVHYYNTTEEVWVNNSIPTVCQVDINNAGDRIVVNAIESGQDMAILFDNAGNLLNKYDELRLSTVGVAMARDSNDIILSTYANTPSKVALVSGDSMQEQWSKTTDVNNYHSKISADGRVGLITDYGEDISIYDCVAGERIMLHETDEWKRSMDLSDDGSFVAVILNDGRLFVYSVNIDTSGAGAFLDNLIDTFTNMDNLFGLLITLGVGVAIGSLIFGLRGRSKGA